MKINTFNKFNKLLLECENSLDKALSYSNGERDIERWAHDDLITVFQNLHNYRLSIRTLVDND